MYLVTRISDGQQIRSIWPAVYLGSPGEYEVHTLPARRRIHSLRALTDVQDETRAGLVDHLTELYLEYQKIGLDKNDIRADLDAILSIIA